MVPHNFQGLTKPHQVSNTRLGHTVHGEESGLIYPRPHNVRDIPLAHMCIQLLPCMIEYAKTAYIKPPMQNSITYKNT